MRFDKTEIQVNLIALVGIIIVGLFIFVIYKIDTKEKARKNQRLNDQKQVIYELIEKEASKEVINKAIDELLEIKVSK